MEIGQVNIERAKVKHTLKKEQRNLFFRKFQSNKLIVIGSIILVFLIALTLLGPLFTPYTSYQMEPINKLQGPSAEHFLGTDEYGRDLFTRIVHGAKVSMGIGLSVSIISSIIGLVIGLCASYFRYLDGILMRIMDGLMAFPSILLAIALMAALGPKTGNVILALTIVFTPYIARVVRSAALVIKEETYIEAMRAQGASTFRIIWRHITPNILSPMIVQATFIFADAIINEASLSFLGAGVPTPDPSWGNILYDGKMVIFNTPWMVIFSGIMIVLSVLGLNLLGDGLRDLLDPHIKGGKKKK
ncbi:ABC transporter permease [Bacillus sp. FJAT-22090]|uniref:ABC transporter permease n=1 Tax=Bacillus sp. FJAT-22090 TaxID=1581038 RepID=UPI0011A87F12|nr:ABC transporter permease [Bacillus sp. FJAT-22090]